MIEVTDSSSVPAPIFIVGAPRSGASRLSGMLSRVPGVVRIDDRNWIDACPGLDAGQRGHDSHRLVLRDATSELKQAIVDGLAPRLRPVDGRAPVLLDAAPRNALRVPFLSAIFPAARFVYLFRDVRETLSGMLDAWSSGNYVTCPTLPDWDGPPWSLLLTPGWRESRGRPLAEVVARQWSTCTRLLLDDLEALDPEAWCVTSYDRVLETPQPELARLCAFLGLPLDPVPVRVGTGRSAASSPAPETWRHHADRLASVVHLVAEQSDRARALFARAPANRPRSRRPTGSPSR